MSYQIIEPSVERWEPGTDWIAHLARVAAVSRRAKTGGVGDRRRVEQCYLRNHVGVFEHWQVVLGYAPAVPHDVPPWRRLGRAYYGTLRHCITDWSQPNLPTSEMHAWTSKGLAPAKVEEMLCFYFVCSRNCLAQLRTYRTAISYLVESQRYCNYDKLGFDFIGENVTTDWMQRVEEEYCQRIDDGLAPEDARGCLPGEFATRMVVSAPRWKWQYLVQQRARHSTGQAQAEIAGLLGKVEEML